MMFMRSLDAPPTSLPAGPGGPPPASRVPGSGFSALRTHLFNAVTGHPAACLAGLVLASLAVHALFAVTRSFGEQDAARIANDALKALYGGSLHDPESSVYSTPLYLDALRHALGWGLVSAGLIPIWMTVSSLLASAGITIAMFLFVRSLTHSVPIALTIAVLVQFNPAFFMFSIYGFPTVPAIALFLFSLVSFQHALEVRTRENKVTLLCLAFLLYLCAVMVKVDVVLASAVFCLPVWVSSRPRKTKMIWTAGILLAALLSFGLFNLYVAHLLPSTGPGAAWSAHFRKFFAGAGALGEMSTWRPLVRAAGLLTMPLAVVATGLIARRREGRALLLWLALAVLPSILYWGILRGNSARHNLLPVIFLYLVLVLPLMGRGRVRWVWAGLLAIMLLVNYAAFMPSSDTVLPSGRLVESAILVKQRAARLHAVGRVIARLPHAKVAVIGEGWVHPYITYEVLQSEQYVRHAGSDAPASPQELIVRDGGTEKDYLMLYDAPNMPRMLSLADEGYFLVIGDQSALAHAADYPPLAGKYVSLDSILASVQ